MKSLKLKAPAKVNYRLDVLRKRSDGYHDLRMIMQRINLCDEIEITMTSRGQIRVACGMDGVPSGQGNIAWRAADALLQLAGKKVGLNIAITKNIPVAAGLGGGSTDAAAVLEGVNTLLGLGLSDAQLMDIGVNLGADVPFFIFKKTALAEGIGEKLSPVDGLPSAWLVLVNPNIHVSTAWVYQNLALTNVKEDYKLPRFSGRTEDICSLLSNDLETVTIQRFPIIQEIKEKLLSVAACGVLMSGSGPTVFGVFSDEDAAQKAAAEVARDTNWFVKAVETL